MLSQLLTLFITPVIYLYLDRIDRMLKRRLEPQLEETRRGRAAARRRGGMNSFFFFFFFFFFFSADIAQKVARHEIAR